MRLQMPTKGQDTYIIYYRPDPNDPLTPWLLAKARATGSLPTARKIIIIHHRSGERIEGCNSCLIPSRGQTFELSR